MESGTRLPALTLVLGHIAALPLPDRARLTATCSPYRPAPACAPAAWVRRTARAARPSGARRRDRTIGELIRLTIETEPELRTMLRLSLEPRPGEQLLLRQGRAIGWIEEALAPLRGRLSRSALRRLVLAIRSACGIEALVWLTDVAGLSREQAAELMRWSALALLSTALAEGGEREERS
jgi:hypothetical protein